MKDFSIENIVSRAWKMACDFWPEFVLLYLIGNLISIFGSGPQIDPDFLKNPDPKELLQIIAASSLTFWNLLTICVGIYLNFVMLNLARRAYEMGIVYQHISDIFRVDFNQLGFFIGIQVVLTLMILAGCFFCLIPGIYLAVRFTFTPLIAATENVGFSEAFKKSWAMTKGHFWKLLGLELVSLGMIILGLCVCCVGVIFAEVIVLFMSIIVYKELLPDTTEDEYVSFEPVEENETLADDTTEDDTDHYVK